MKNLISLLVLLLASCGSPANHSARRGSEVEAGVGYKELISDESALAEARRFHAGTDYSRFPAEVGPLIREFEVQNYVCRGRGDIPASPRSCNRRFFVGAALRRHGWCFGARRPLDPDQWLRCREDYGTRRGAAVDRTEPFSENHIVRVAADHRRNAGLLPQSGVSGGPSRDEIEALRTPLGEAWLGRFPQARYQSFPASIRALLQRYDIEDARCLPHSGPLADALRACNRRHHVGVALERLGWCIEEERRHPCAEVQDHWPGLRETDGPIYPDSFVDFIARNDRHAA